MDQVVIQGIGFVALLFVIFSFQKNKRLALLSFMLIGLLLFVVHYSLLGAWIGALMNLIEAGMVFVAFKKETRLWAQQKFWPYLFISLFIIAGAVTSKSWVDSFPVLAQIFGTIAVWQTNPRAIRFIMLAPRPLWFIYNLIVGSYAGMATEIFIFLSVVTGIVRFDILGKPKKQAKE
ncbi:hypothetical protein A3C59_04430 [Candidatus Daviesbacteria bacterium RIFCSPHIGHO2_02_FULL_36_13]|uniref:YgjV family protein n=1 Tax=Candidatus Daviesbacteria bacterium RIFCSPHIGHO2_02_FULL_36_13 TaxID=1797768 RepID=A0A1F5JWL7_9BACT|nr:MAG: hypothetical protein A3C59_04430 [Candidatus Daviesbacteria bacterium RIFCSPHIGHO2_02_FULL_36_13]